MIRITYADGPIAEVEEGTTVLEASLRNGIDHMHACGGDARCTTCRIAVIDGEERCPAPREKEAEVLEMNGFSPPVRLACQLRPAGDVTVRVLVRESAFQALARPEGMARELDVAVLFADIRGFTSFAEQKLPFDVLHVLNRYFDRMGTVVEFNGGRVISFQGDGMMCLFGIGGRRREAAVQAVTAGLQMLDAVAVQAKYCAAHFALDLRVGVGIDFGRAVVGEVGYYRNTQLNAIGDVVNTAARVQELTKETDAALLVTQPVADRVARGFDLGPPIGVEIRGKAGRHNLYEVRGRAKAQGAKR